MGTMKPIPPDEFVRLLDLISRAHTVEDLEKAAQEIRVAVERMKAND